MERPLSVIDHLKSPLLLSWQLTRECDLSCLHCCTESAPGKRLPGELSRQEALALTDEIIAGEVPYVMLCGGEPLVVAHFWELAERLGRAGVQLKIETNGQRLNESAAERMSRLPIRSVQISLDGATEDVYGQQRPGGSLAKAHAACRAAVSCGVPLEVTFAPTRINLHEAEKVIEQARSLGAFRFNTGRLMRIGTAARLWDKLELTEAQYQQFHQLLQRKSKDLIGDRFELCFEPFSVQDGLRRSLADPPATLLVLPNGLVKLMGVLPYVCGDLRRDELSTIWENYCRFWNGDTMKALASDAIMDASLHARANDWQTLLTT